MATVLFLIVSTKGYAGFGDALKKATNKSSSTSSQEMKANEQQVKYQAGEDRRAKAKALGEDVNQFAKTLLKTNYKAAVAKMNEKVGVSPIKTDKFSSKWRLDTHDPSCVLVQLVMGPDNNVNSASAWTVHAADGSSCAESYSASSI